MAALDKESTRRQCRLETDLSRTRVQRWCFKEALEVENTVTEGEVFEENKEQAKTSSQFKQDIYSNPNRLI